VIAYGICIGSEDTYLGYARPGLAASVPHDATVLEARDQTSIFPAYNGFLDAVADDPSLEALVLLHEDVELRDPRFEQKVRAELADDQVAVLGVIGAVGVRSLAWWESDGRGRCDETRGLIDFGGLPSDVDSVDGLLLVLSPWAVRNLRFDEETFDGFHGYDADICFQARASDRQVRVIDIDLFHHTKGGYGDVEAYQVADAAFQGKWYIP
jgi:Glycosyltransferase like family